MKDIVGPGSSGLDTSKEIVAVETGVESLVARDQWDRPLILRPGGHLDPCKPRKGKGGGCFCATGYTRVSTMAETLSDSFGLSRYQKGNVVKGMSRRPDLATAVKVVGDNKSALYEIVDIAEQLGDDNGAAVNGSTFHTLTEIIDKGGDLPPDLPANVLAMLDAYVKCMKRHRFEVQDTEGFVVQDKIEVAGSFDKRMSDLIGDVKTGQNLNLMALKVTMQVAMYAAGSYYDIGTGDRTPLGVDRDKGVLLWAPWVEDPKDATCEARWLDLKGVGRPAVLQAVKTRELRKLKAEQIMPRIK